MSDGEAVTETIHHGREWPIYSSEVAHQAAELVRQGRSFDYGRGPEIAEIEDLFAERHDGRYALAVNSGTSALFVAYYLLGLGPGDEVLVPSFTFLATASPLLLLGAVPVLCDSGGPDGNVTADKLRSRITPRTKAIVVTHLFGFPCPMDEIVRLAEENGLALVEDCSHAHGSTWHGRSVGTFGDISIYSIGGVKMVSGGMGGMVLCRSRRHYETGVLLTSFKQRSRLEVHDPELRRLVDLGLGGNLRISPIAAVLAASHVRGLAGLVAVKSANAARVREALAAHPGVTVPPVPDGAAVGGWYDVVAAVDPEGAGFTRDQLLAALRAEGLRVRAPSTGPLHLTSIFSGGMPAGWRHYSQQDRARYFNWKPSDLPRSLALHESWVSMPATYLHGADGLLARSYQAGIERAFGRLGQRALSGVEAR